MFFKKGFQEKLFKGFEKHLISLFLILFSQNYCHKHSNYISKGFFLKKAQVQFLQSKADLKALKLVSFRIFSQGLTSCYKLNQFYKCRIEFSLNPSPFSGKNHIQSLNFFLPLNKSFFKVIKWKLLRESGKHIKKTTWKAESRGKSVSQSGGQITFPFRLFPGRYYRLILWFGNESRQKERKKRSFHVTTTTNVARTRTFSQEQSLNR